MTSRKSPVFSTFASFITIHILCLNTRWNFARADLCPPIFGEFGCPNGFDCVFGACKNKEGQEPPTECSKLACDPDSQCLEGRCLPYEGMPCGRNVLVAENTARTIVTDCGTRGKCVGGRCVINKCHDVICDEKSELCRDGRCAKVLGNFCFSSFDCGPPFECQANKCERRLDFFAPSYSPPKPRCDPGEIFQNERCVQQEGCAQLVCERGQSCFNGFCIPASIDCGPHLRVTSAGTNRPESVDCPDGMICRQGRCFPDPCQDKCPPEHACSNDGECRLLQGLICLEDCPSPFECVNGLCTKDECKRKLCQIGERCENGLCIRIEQKACKTTVRDCGEHFSCENGVCRDQIRVLDEKNLDEEPTAVVALNSLDMDYDFGINGTNFTDLALNFSF